MKIAVTYENENIFQHFGHTQSFKIYETDDESVKRTQIINATDGGHSALAVLLKENGIDALICGGIGAGAINALKENGIKVFGGVSGACDKAVNDFVCNKLDYNPNVRCSHHEQHHQGEGATCHGPNGCNHNHN